MIYASRFLRLTTPLMQGPDILLAQGLLKEAGFYRGTLDGVFGELSEHAAKSFQDATGLLSDGIIGPSTWTYLVNRRDFSGPHINWGQKKVRVYRICIDTETKILTRCDSNNKVKTYPVAVGKPSTPTPLGEWIITQKIPNPGGPFGARWMRLSVPWGGYGIHGTNNPSSIGKAVSHGCVRMYNNDVIELYDLVTIGTPVSIIGKVFTGRILKIGSEGTDVKEVQEILTVLGYYNSSIDGIWGPKTQQAVINFKTAQGLPSDGKVGARTYEALQKAYDVVKGDYLP